MDSEGYPTQDELELIKKWDVKDFPALLDFIEDLHVYKDYVKREVIREWYRKENPILQWTFCTGGWSGNESLVDSLLKNEIFKLMWYYSWQRGGRFVFHINPTQVGFKLVKDYCRDNKVSRQYISQNIDKFDRFELSRNKIFIRPNY